MYDLVNDIILPSTIMYRTENRLSTISFKNEDVLKIIKSLNINKAHGHDDISIRLLQICGAEVVKPLSLIFKNCIQYGIFPNLWKKSNIVPIHKKGDKQCMVNYRPVSLLPICGKIFERLTQFLSSFRKTNYFLLINLFFDQMALVKINCCELLIVLMQILIKVLHLKEELTS